MPKNKVAISKINLKIGDKEIELSLAEAQELREILNETFGAKIEIKSSPVFVERPYVYPHYPHTWWSAPVVTCNGDNTSWTLTTSGTSTGNLNNSTTVGALDAEGDLGNGAFKSFN